MAQSKCSKCETPNFEIVPVKPGTCQFQLTFVQCAKCGTVVGVLESKNINERLDKIESYLATTLSQMNSKLSILQAK
jgi:4-aminobutyrate aminotransferase-like enzyme